MWYEAGVQIHSFACGYSVVPAHPSLVTIMFNFEIENYFSPK